MTKTQQKNLSKCCSCFNPEFNDLISRIETTINGLSSDVTKARLYGFSCDKQAIEKIEVLISLYHVLVEENRNILLGGKPCLDCDDFQRLAEKVRKLTKAKSTDSLQIDRSNENVWVAQNPTCVSMERWQSFCNKLLCDLKLDVKAKRIREDCFDLKMSTDKNVCDFTFEIVRNLIPCDVVLAVSAYKQVCDLGLKVCRTKEECKLDFEILKSETNCNLDFKTYATLVDCNLSFDVIKTIYENGCEITFDPEVTILEVDCDTCVDPIILTAPPINFLCLPEDEPTIEDSFQYVSSEGGCGDVTLFWIGDSGFSPCPKVIERTFIGEDECGNFSDPVVLVITIDDTCVPDSGCAAPCPCI